VVIRIRKVEWDYYKIEDDESHDDIALTFRYDSTDKTKEFTEKEGETIMEFLDWLALAVEESFDSQGA